MKKLLTSVKGWQLFAITCLLFLGACMWTRPARAELPCSSTIGTWTGLVGQEPYGSWVLKQVFTDCQTGTQTNILATSGSSAWTSTVNLPQGYSCYITINNTYVWVTYEYQFEAHYDPVSQCGASAQNVCQWTAGWWCRDGQFATGTNYAYTTRTDGRSAGNTNIFSTFLWWGNCQTNCRNANIYPFGWSYSDGPCDVPNDPNPPE